MEKELEKSKDKTKKKLIIKRAAGLLLILLVVAGSLWAYREYFEQGDVHIEATGTIEATMVELNSRLPGAITKIAVNTGDLVAEGQLVVELSRNDLVAQRERDALGVLKAEAQLNDLTSGARSQEISEASANVNIARANFDQTTADYDRAEALFSEAAMAKAEFEKAQMSLELSKYQLQAAESRLSLLQDGTRPQVVNAARAEVERNKAILKATDFMLQDTKIYSPREGTVISKNYEEGEFIQAGASVVTVADLEDLWIKVYIATDDLPYIKLGQSVSFTVSGYNREFAGEVVEIASRGEFTPKTIQTKQERTNVVFGVKIKINSAEGVLKPGMPADVVMGRRQDQ